MPIARRVRRLYLVLAMSSALMMTPPATTTAGAAPNCVPIPHADEVVSLLEPRNAAIYDPRGIWIEFSVVPFGEDIRGLFILAATAVPLDGAGAGSPLVVDRPYRLSGDMLGTTAQTSALWIAHVAKPSVPSRVTVTYSLNLWQTASGGPCDGPPDVRRLGQFIWVPTNGVGPFGQRPPVR